MTKPIPFIKKRLFAPGPTPVPLASMLASLEHPAYHRCAAFYNLFSQVREMLAPLFGTSGRPLLLSSSGTGAMEAAVVNFTNPGDEVLCLVGGKFGERWEELCKTYSCQTKVLAFPWGEAPKLDDIAAHLRSSDRIKAVFLQAHETSTGVALPVKEIAALVNEQSSALLVVDAISSLGAQEMLMDKWGVDVVIGGSQKGFAAPPGLAFLAASKRAKASYGARPRYYFDLRREDAGQDKGQSAFTPATSIVSCLHRSLEEIHKLGVSNMLSHHERTARAVRAALRASGFRLLSEESPSPALTAAYLPEGVSYKELSKILSETYADTFAGGQGRLEGKILRFAHLGIFDYFDVAAGIIALEQALAKLGSRRISGRGIERFMEAFADDAYAESLL